MVPPGVDYPYPGPPMLTLLLASALASDCAADSDGAPACAVDASEEQPAHLSYPDGTDLWVTWPAVLLAAPAFDRCVTRAQAEPAIRAALDACAEQSDLDARLADAQAAVIREQERALRAEKRARAMRITAIVVGVVGGGAVVATVAVVAR